MQILRSASASTTYAFGMRVDDGPFADNRIRAGDEVDDQPAGADQRRAVRVRQVGNDLQGPNCQYFDSDLKPEYDVDKAKSLFKAAGVEGNTFVLPTANVLPGMIESSTIWAQQAKAAGINIQLKVLQPGNYWTSAGGAYIRPFCLQVAQPCRR